MSSTQDEKPRSARRQTWAEYYEDNRERISNLRKEKYAKDPRYREQVRRYARLRWQRDGQYRVDAREKQIQGIRAGMNADHQKNGTRKLMQRSYQLDDGTNIIVSPMVDLCLRVGIPKHSVKRWTQGGVLPKPTMVDNRGRYWYSEEYIYALSEVYEHCRSCNWALSDFKEALKGELPNAEW